MHPRNPYQISPEFSVLAETYPPLKPHLITTPTGTSIDFKNETSQRRLTEAILHRDFGLTVELPPERLCPPVPNRLNYILWLEDVLEVMGLADPSSDTNGTVRGLDIGTGASAIYPLLGCATHRNWVFTGTDVDHLSLQTARRNVERNNLGDRIQLFHADPAGRVLQPLYDNEVAYDFTMCNPPFYESREEVIQATEDKEFAPNAVCTGADVEMITPGGEVAFVGRMVTESLELKGKCRWFTSMLGKMSSLHYIVGLLREHKVDNYAITELVQGQTRRWVVGWSFGEARLPDSIGRLTHHGLQHVMPTRNTLYQRLPHAKSITQVMPMLSAVLRAVDGLFVTKTMREGEDVVVAAPGDSWSRAARRKKRDRMQEDGGVPGSVKLACRIRCENRVAVGGENAKVDIVLVFDWVAGRDRGLFESFASHVERKVTAMVAETR